MRDARCEEKETHSDVGFVFAFWLLASGPSPNFSLSQSPSAAAAPVVLFRVRYSSAARVLCPFLVFFFLSLSFSPISDFDFPLFFFFFGGVWSLVFGSNSVLCWWGGSPSPSSCSLYSLASPPFSIFVFSFLVVCQISVPCSI